jgi:hypothetical protein
MRLISVLLVIAILAICILPLIVYASPVYTGVQAVFSQENVRAVGGIPTGVDINNMFFGFSLPIWNGGANIDEELHFQVDVPDWWDGTSDILIHIHTATTGDESGQTYELELAHNHSTPNVVEAFPAVGDYAEVAIRPIASALTYAHHMEIYTLPYAYHPADPIIIDDVLAFRVRRVNTNQQDNLKGELIVINDAVVYFARGDMLGEEAAMAVALLEIASVMVVAVIGLIALGLTIVLFWAREPMMGWAAVIFWLIFGGACFYRSTAVWDIYYFVGFGSILGMTILCGAGSFQFYKSGKNGDFIGDEGDKTQYIGESKSDAHRENRAETDDSMSEQDMPSDDEMERRPRPSARTQDLRDRAKKRKTWFGRKPRWGEFK